MGLFSNKKKTEDSSNKEGKKEASKKEASLKPSENSMKDLYKGEAVKESVATDKNIKKSKNKFSNSYKILVKPLITEKGSDLGALNKYIFEISPKANKIEVARAIKDVYGINPVSVNIMNVQGKIVTRGRYSGRRKNTKKAVVTLPKGKTIQVYEGI